MRRPLRAISLALLLLAAGCGGGGDTPTGPGPTREPTFPVNVVVFEDDNGNGRLDADEGGRVPDVEIRVGSGSGRSAPGSGRAIVMAPAGAQTVTVSPSSLPPFFVPGPPLPVQVPATADVHLPLTLPTGLNNVRLFMPFGDSITAGEGSTDGVGYPNPLERKLAGFFGGATVMAEARAGRISQSGVRFIEDAINRRRPGYTLILLGTNDWNLPVCQDKVPCEVIDNLREIVRRVKGKQSLPVLGTIPPVNPTINAGRNTWVSQTNDLLRTMAGQEGAVVADVFGTMNRAGNLAALFADEVHPNNAGHELIAQAFFEAITKGKVGGS